MTSAGKLFFGTCILTAAYFTAKYVHQTPNPAPTIPVIAKPTAAKLIWQVRPVNENAHSELREVASAQEPLGEVRFARMTSAEENVVPPKPFDAEFDSRDALNASFETQSTNERPVVPFALASSPQPQVALMRVDDEEEGVGIGLDSSAGEFVHHTVQFGDTLPQIALQYTGRRESYMAIYRANLDVLSSPAEVTPGIVLKIPVR